MAGLAIVADVDGIVVNRVVFFLFENEWEEGCSAETGRWILASVVVGNVVIGAADAVLIYICRCVEAEAKGAVGAD